MGYLHVAAGIETNDPVRIVDRPHPDLPIRIVNIEIGRFTFMTPEDDLARIAFLDRLIAAAAELRGNATARVAASESCAICKRPGDHATHLPGARYHHTLANVEPVDMAPGELVEAWGK